MTRRRSMLLQLCLPSRQKLLLIASSLLIWAGIGVLFLLHGYEPTWRLWGLRTYAPFFIDFRLLPGMVESLHRGLDPTVHNLGDPLGRVFNYPSIWYLLSYTGLSQADTLWAGLVLLGLFFVGLFLFPGRLHVADVGLLLLVAFSPAAMLLYERANVDLLMFFLGAVAVSVVQISTGIALAVIGLGAVLKFFPIFGLSVFLFKEKRVFFAVLIFSALFFSAYLLLLSRDLRIAWDLTQRGIDASYGAKVLVMHFAAPIKHALNHRPFGPDVIPGLASAASYIAALLLAGCFSWLGLRLSEPLASSSERNLIAFWMGAAIYMGTFLLGNNWDYRLVFLLFIVPQLGEWMRSAAGGTRLAAFLAMGVTLLSCWYLFAMRFVPNRAEAVAFVADELANWTLFGVLAYLFAASLPAGLRSLLTLPSAPPVPQPS